ncbi:MAG: hypothetical protein VYC55_07975 [Pseudomonadota bacterium]|nr:hypothetical protein [Pseudomonadota bacterium]
MIKIIGIDPDMRKPGIVECIDGDFDFMESPKYNSAMIIEDIPIWIKNGYVFAIEDVNKNKPVYPRVIKAKSQQQKDAIKGTIAQRVGMVKGAATIIQDYIEHHGGKVILVPHGIGKQTKNNAKLFAELTGYTGRTNEDTRDAYWIAKYAYNQVKNGAK